MRSFVVRSSKLFRNEALVKNSFAVGGVRHLNVHEYVSSSVYNNYVLGLLSSP